MRRARARTHLDGVAVILCWHTPIDVCFVVGTTPDDGCDIADHVCVDDSGASGTWFFVLLIVVVALHGCVVIIHCVVFFGAVPVAGDIVVLHGCHGVCALLLIVVIPLTCVSTVVVNLHLRIAVSRGFLAIAAACVAVGAIVMRGHRRIGDVTLPLVTLANLFVVVIAEAVERVAVGV